MKIYRNKTISLLLSIVLLTGILGTPLTALAENETLTLGTSDNLIQNSGFESGTDSWIWTDSSTGVTSGNQYSDINCAWMDPGESNVISQTVTILTTGDYRMSAWFTAGSSGGIFGIKNSAGDVVASRSIPGNSTYFRIKIDGLSFNQSDTVQVFVSGGASWVNADEFELKLDTGDPDQVDLGELITQVQELDESDFASEDWAELQKVLSEALTVYETSGVDGFNTVDVEVPIIVTKKGEASPQLIVTEVQPDNSGSDSFEFFEVYNTTSQDINLTEQSIGISYDTASDNVAFEYPANTVIKAKTAVVFWLSYNDGSVNNTNYTDNDFKNYYVISGAATDTTTDNTDSEYDIVRVTGLNGMSDTGDFGIHLSDSSDNVLSESYCPKRTAEEDRPYEFCLSEDFNIVLLDDDVLPSPGKTKLKQNINTIYDETISSGIQYKEENITNYYDTNYKEHINRLEIDLSNPDTYVLASKAYDTVNAMETIGDQAEREIDRGYNVVAGINADMYDMTTGIPISIQIKENRLIVSQSPYEEINAVRPALFIDSDNKAGIDRLSSEGTVIVGSYSSSISMFNRNQEVTDDIVIYTSDVSANHTLTHAYGYGTAAFALIEMDSFSGLYPGMEHTGTVKEIFTTDGFEIPDGYAVLAGYGTRAAAIGAFTVGTSASFSFNYCVGDGKTVKNEIQNATVMNTWLVKDGHANLEFEMTALSDYVRTTNARTAIGVKADGTLVAVTIDKPSTKYNGSVGVTMAQMAKYLRDIGCVDALNLDGGGSTEMIVRKAGEAGLETVNVPSDGNSRIVTSALLFVSKAESSGIIKNVVVDKNVSLYKGSSYNFTCRLSDQTGHAVNADGQNIVWSTTFGTIDQNGHYIAPNNSGSGTVTATVNGVSGSCTVTSVDTFSSIVFTAGNNVVLDASASQQFKFLAYSSTGSEVLIDLNLVAWNLSGDIGTVSSTGVVSITATSGSGVLTAEIGGQTLTAEVTVGVKEQIIDDFEMYPIEAYHLDGYGYGNVAQYAGNLGSSSMLSFSTDIVHSGKRSFKLDYDFSKWSRSSNGTLNLKPHWNTTIGSWTNSMAAQMATTYTTKIYPKKFGLWVFGDSQAPWLRAIMLAGDGSSKTLDLTTDTNDINWTGWKYIEVEIPEGWELPISLKYVYSVETNKQKGDYSGSIYFDDLRFVFTDEVSDFSGPEFSSILPSAESIYVDSIDFSTAITDDISGVDIDSIVVKVNNVEKTDYNYEASTGKLSFSLQNLKDGDYTVYVEAYDGAGNQSVPWIEKTYHIDTSEDVEAPVLTNVTPTSNVTVKIPTPRITFNLLDAKSKVGVTEISLKLDNEELSVYYDADTGWGYAEPETDLSAGSHVLSIDAGDSVGNMVHYTDSIDVEPIAQPADSKNFSISIIPDTQGNVYTERIFTRAEADGTSLVLHMGDIVDAGTQADYDTAEEYAKIFNDKPLFVAAGNHEAFLDTLDIFYEKFGSPTYHFDYGDTMIVFLNSAYGQSITTSDSTQLHYLQEVLKKNTKPNVIVVNHVITHDSFGTAHAMTTTEAKQFEAILSTYKSSHPDVTIDVLFGHLHTLQSWETDGVNYIITGNAANKNYVTYDEGSFLGSGKITVENGLMNFSYDPFLTSVTIEDDQHTNDSIVIEPNDELQLELIGNFNESPSNYSTNISSFDLVDIKWNSSDPELATVNKDGLVKAHKIGVTTITAISGGKSASITLKVEEHEKKVYDLYFGIDIKNGKLENETGSTVASTYSTTGATGYEFLKDDELNQTVLCGPESGNLVIDNLNLASLNNQYTVEAYIKISSIMSAYDAFQFTGQNINLVGMPGATYFGAGKCSAGDGDVFTDKNLPTDQWIHVICTAKEGEQTLYVNGAEFASNNYTGLNLTSTNDDELVLGGTYDGRSGLIKYAALRIYSNFVADELEAKDMYKDMKNNFSVDETTIDTSTIYGVTIPVTGAAPTATIADTTEYTATISWLPAEAAFSAGTVYQATIIITPKAGYTLSGVTENFFTIVGASSVSNAADSGIITAEFPATKAITLQQIDITKPADKLEYIVGDSLDITGMVITGTYNDNTTKSKTITVSDVTGFDSSVAVESQTLTVTVEGKTTTYMVTIKEGPVQPGSAVISPTAVTYDLNNPTDLSTTIIWNSAQSITVVKYGLEELTSNDMNVVSGSAIALSESTLTIKSDYLLSQGFSQGDKATFNITFDNNNTASFTINIVNSNLLSNDATLSNLTVGGITLKDFASEVTEYSLELPYGIRPGNAEATVAAAASDSKAEVSITQAANLPGSAIITVTAEDKITTKIYTVTLTTSMPSEPTYTLTISAGSGGSITSGNGGAYAEGTVINISAKASTNYSFHNWSSSDGGSFGNVHDVNTTFTMPAKAAVITANFLYSGSSNPGSDNPGSDNTNGNNNNNESTSDKKESDNKPVIKDSQLSGWEAIEIYIENGKDEKLVVDMQGNTSVPGSLFETIKGKNIPVTFVVAEGIEWTINGKYIPEDDKEQAKWKDIDLKVTKNTDAIPSKLIDELIQSDETKGDKTQTDKSVIPISLSYEGNFGFTATLRINLDRSNVGRVANLYYYNPVSGQLELQGVGFVDADGYVSYEFTHASDYVILMDSGDALKAEMEGITVTTPKDILYVGGTEDTKTTLTIEYPKKLKDLIEKGIYTPKVSYQSEDKNVARVMTNGKITALNEGETTITTIVTINGVSMSFRTNVLVKTAYIEFVQSKDSMKTGQSYKFKVVGHGVDISKNIWKTTKNSIVVINKTTGKAQAKAAGVDYVVAKVGRISAEIKVTVK